MQESKAVYSRNILYKLFLWYESLGDINCAQSASVIIHNGKKYVVEHVKCYDTILSYHNKTGFSLPSKDQEFQLLVKKIVYFVSRGLINKIGEYLKKMQSIWEMRML
jgi:uncharacterized protein YlzI (FlbEa/FlbD family)